MIQLTNNSSGQAGELLFINPNSIISIQPWEGTTRIDTLDCRHFVTESPEQVAQKVLEYRLAMVRYQASVMHEAPEHFAWQNERYTLMCIAGLEDEHE